MRTRETLDIMQAHAGDLSDAEVRFLGSFYSVAAMDGQTAQHIQENVLKYSRDDVTTIMYVTCEGLPNHLQQKADHHIMLDLVCFNLQLMIVCGAVRKSSKLFLSLF